jgi:transcriptional regulator with GAF, ATPase, and Fis domain
LPRLKYPAAYRLPSLKEELKRFGRKIIDCAKCKVMKDLEFPDDSELSMDKDLLDYLITRPYEGNYRELENVLYHAIMNRNLKEMDNLSMSCIKDLPDKHAQITVSDRTYPTMKLSTVLSEATELEALFIEEKSVLMTLDYENVNFAEILSSTEKVRSLIAKGMLMHLSKSEIDFKKAMSISGLSLTAYQTHLKGIKKILGMTATDYVKEYKKTHAT